MPDTRFAPSPTGWLHLGHAYSARVTRDLSGDGRFLLRFEDIDHTRVRPEFYAGIEHDLRWLGLDWDGEPLRQSERVDAYAGTLGLLREMGAVYPCFCTRREIQAELASRSPRHPTAPRDHSTPAPVAGSPGRNPRTESVPARPPRGGSMPTRPPA